MKTRRHAKILELIKAFDIDTQEELLRYLREEGFDVTQATVSRDIKELRLVKDPVPVRQVQVLHRQRIQQRHVRQVLLPVPGLRALGGGGGEHAGDQVHDRHGPGRVRLYGRHALAELCGGPWRGRTPSSSSAAQTPPPRTPRKNSAS